MTAFENIALALTIVKVPAKEIEDRVRSIAEKLMITEVLNKYPCLLYTSVGSCSNLGDAQARRLRIRVKGENGNYFAHTLNNTVVAPPRMLIAFLENNLREDGSVAIPEVLRPYMGGKESLQPKK